MIKQYGNYQFLYFEICRLLNTENYEISFEELALNYDEIEKGENFVVFNNNLKNFYRVKYDNEILLNSILINYKQNVNKNNEIIINGEKQNSASDFDIFGLLSLELKNNNFENIQKILIKIKYIENSHLLAYIIDIYQNFNYKYKCPEGFEDCTDNNEQKLKLFIK